MREAMFYEKKEASTVQCHLCPHNCVIADGKRGICRVRENREGILYSLVYARPYAAAVDPIEKKPLFHFLPGSRSFSIGTVGCNLSCMFCQNWESAQASPEDVPGFDLSPEEAVAEAIAHGCSSISYTYNEPSMFYEYVLDIAKVAHKRKLKNVMVTNGYISIKPLQQLYKHIDAANVDLKSFDESFYQKTCKAKLAPVLESLKKMKKLGTWIELTTLIIPTLNDDMAMIARMCDWIAENLGPDTPLHFSAFHPCYKLTSLPSTPLKTLEEAGRVARKAGLKYVYLGNVMTCDGENTYCPECRALLIRRQGFSIRENNLKSGACPKCKTKIPGVWA